MTTWYFTDRRRRAALALILGTRLDALVTTRDDGRSLIVTFDEETRTRTRSGERVLFDCLDSIAWALAMPVTSAAELLDEPSKRSLHDAIGELFGLTAAVAS